MEHSGQCATKLRTASLPSFHIFSPHNSKLPHGMLSDQCYLKVPATLSVQLVKMVLVKMVCTVLCEQFLYVDRFCEPFRAVMLLCFPTSPIFSQKQFNRKE